MQTAIELQETKELVPTDKFSWAKWNFANFNPVQSTIFDIINQDCNCLIAASTSAGKTVIAEMFGAYEIRNQKKKFLFLVPLRALANEKYYDWTSSDHHFGNLKIGIFTGDYKKDNKNNSIENYDVIIMTSEMLNHKLRASAQSVELFKKIGVVVVDESHLLTVEGRGDHLEAALMNLSNISPDTRLVLLSATLPNVEQVANWMEKSLNGKKTYIIRSKYRPCVLKIHTVTYDDTSSTRASVYEMIDTACDIVLRHSADKFLIFVHAKKIGQMFLDELKRRNVNAEFHNANLEKDQRANLENKFKNDKSFRVLVATSTLAWGVNLPARRVVVAGVTRGPELVPSYDVLQMVGRAGRPAFDPQGDAYVLFPDSKRLDLEKIVLTPCDIQSKMTTTNVLGLYSSMAFHLVYEIYSENVKSIKEANNWYDRTFACFQNVKINISILEKTLERLVQIGIIFKDKDETLSIGSLGKISSLFYVDPFDVANWSSNFTKLFSQERLPDIDVCLSLANTSSNLVGNLSKEDKNDMQKFLEAIAIKQKKYPENVTKIAYLYYKILNGRYEARHISLYQNLKNDIPRIIEVLKGIDSIAKGWKQKDFFTVLAKRMQHGVPAKLVDLIEIKGIGKVKAEKLYNKGYASKTAILKNIDEASKICGIKPENLKKSIID